MPAVVDDEAAVADRPDDDRLPLLDVDPERRPAARPTTVASRDRRQIPSSRSTIGSVVSPTRFVPGRELDLVADRVGRAVSALPVISSRSKPNAGRRRQAVDRPGRRSSIARIAPARIGVRPAERGGRAGWRRGVPAAVR